jgi:beta-glucanase (GH16 family)
MPSRVISIQNGIMNLYLHTEDGIHMVSAPTPELPRMLYGRYAIRFRADAVPGYKTAWLLWPDSENWPEDGEIDYPEGNLDGTISAFMHRQDGTSGGDQDVFHTDARYTTWHTAITEWAEDYVNFIMDGEIIGTSTSRIPNTPMHWVIQTETRIGGGPPSDDAEGNVEIDWVAVWEPGPETVSVIQPASNQYMNAGSEIMKNLFVFDIAGRLVLSEVISGKPRLIRQLNGKPVIVISK